MKMTESQLKQIIKEELEGVLEEYGDEELEEGFWSGLKGMSKPLGKDVGRLGRAARAKAQAAADKARAAGKAVSDYGGKLAFAAKLGSAAEDMQKRVNDVLKLANRLDALRGGSFANNIPDRDLRKRVSSSLSKIKRGAEGLNEAAAELRELLDTL